MIKFFFPLVMLVIGSCVSEKVSCINKEEINPAGNLYYAV